MGVTLPGAPDLATYWHNLQAGVDAITAVPDGRHDAAFHAEGPDGPERTYCHRGGFVEQQVAIDLAAAGIMPGSVDGMDPDQLLALAVASAAVADAGGMERLGAASRIGVVLGRGGYLTSAMVRFEHRVRTVPALLRAVRTVLPDADDEVIETLREHLLAGLGPHSPESTIGLVPNLSASRVANRLDLRGPAYTVDAACASSLVAVDQAMTDLATGRCDTVLAGGVHHCHDETIWSVFTQLGALSRRGRIAPFAADADGLLIAEGTGVVVLKRLDDARRAGDRIYAVITGAGVSGDGKGRSLFAPDSGGQTEAVRAAWREAGVDPAAPGSVGLLEAHGTATRAGDDAELTTLAEVFGGPAGDTPVIGSVKSMIGHAMPAAGVAALVKAALAVHHGVLLPTLHAAVPNPLLARTRFRVLDRAEPWAGDGPRRAGVDAFGFGGINAHVVLEETAPAHQPARVSEPQRVLRLAARTPAELAELLDTALPDTGEPVGHGPCRLGIVGPTERSLRTARAVVNRAAQQGTMSWRGRGDVWFTTAPLLPAGRVTYVFPGLEAAFEPTVADVAAHLGRRAPAAATVGDDLFGHADGVMAVGRLLADATAALGVPADAMLGHSVGEWVAMAAAGMFGAGMFEGGGSDTDPAVLRRRFWPDGLTVPDVVFAALGCGRDEAAVRIVDEPGLVVSHDNAPRQSIVCGPAAAIARLLRRCRDDGVIARELPFRSGFHTPAFTPMTEPFRQLAAALPMRPGRVPVVSCTTVAPFPADGDLARRIYLRHLVEPVRFREAVLHLWDAGHRVFVVMGTGGVGSFVTDTLGEREHLVVAAGSERHAGLDQLRRVAVACWVDGGEPDLDSLNDRPAARLITRPSVAVRLGVTPLELDPAAVATLRAAAAPVPFGPSPSLPGMSPAAAGPSPADLPPLPADLSPVVAAALHALHEDTAAATHAVLAAVGAGRGAPTPTRAAPSTAGHPTEAPQTTGPAPAGPGPSAPRREPDAVPDPDERRVVVPVSLDAMPELAGHRFHRQRDGWPDEADRRPVVPATAIIDLAVEHATAAWPGTAVTGVRDARFLRWLTAAPAREVEIVMRRVSAERIDVTVGEFARLTLHTGTGAPLPPPRPAPPSPTPPPHDAAAVYERRLMFHEDGYQGITAVHGVGAHHAHGEITVPAGRGGLLDNVGQMLGVWLLARHDHGLVALPRRIDAIDWTGSLPGPGARVDCLVTASATPDTIVMDAQLVHDGRVIVAIRGWDDVRMPFDGVAKQFQAFPDRTSLATPARGGVYVVHDGWPGSASCDFLAGFVLNSAELDRYERLTPRGRRQWLLGRIAAKDAVRGLLGEQLFPAEVWITNDDRGRPLVRGRHRELPAVTVSLAHRGAVGVALAGPPGSRPGVDVEPVAEVSASTVAAAIGADERPLWDSLGGGGAWFARFWTAKEAAAKARGTGLEGRPQAFRVLAADEDSALVCDPDGSVHRVRFDTIDVAGQPHVVARTGGPPERHDRARDTP